MNAGKGTLRILAVDDNRTNLHILQVFLKKLGHEVILAENGEDAVKRFQAEQPDAVLLDIMMPIMDGFEAARRIKALSQERWVPIIFLSALNRDENLVEGLEAGGDDYLTKPVNFIVLEAKMRSMQRSLELQRHAIEAYRRLQVISDHVLESIITIDSSGSIVACNQATEIIFGWTPTELLGRNVNVLIPPRHAAEHDDHIRDYLMGGAPQVIGISRDVEALHRNGTVFAANLSISEVKLEGSRLFIGVVRDISEQKRVEQQLRDNAAQLKAYYEHTQNEQQLAMRLMHKQLHRRGLKDRCVRYKLIPAENFSGDVVAAVRSAEGRLYALLADATGHGLTAAISVLPVLAIFYRMAGLNHSVREIIEEFNQQLHESMPIGRFVAATLVCLDEAAKRGEIWVGGMPGAFLLDPAGGRNGEFASTRIPLGIVDNREIDSDPAAFTWNPGDQLILCSDGLLEAESPNGQRFGADGLDRATAGIPPGQRFASLEAALTTHLGGKMAADDVSFMLIDCL